MPLHLLGKKSWNVYNHDNVERVKRDEAEAAAKESAAEQRMQEIDAERRIRLLRGLPVDALEDSVLVEDEAKPASSQKYSERDRKRRRLAGEDDTDRDIRYAKEAQAYSASTRDSRKRSPDISLRDANGHVNLFPEKSKRDAGERNSKNPEVEQEKARKERELEDQYTMRFSNAAGFKDSVDKPQWYHGKFVVDGGREMPSKNVWHKEDPGRKDREQKRIIASDPLAAIQQGVRGVRQAVKDRNEWKEKQRHEIDELSRHERRESARRKTKDFEEFDLNASIDNPATEGKSKKSSRHHHRERVRDRSRSRSPHRHHSHHHHKHRHRQDKQGLI